MYGSGNLLLNNNLLLPFYACSYSKTVLYVRFVENWHQNNLLCNSICERAESSHFEHLFYLMGLCARAYGFILE
jgi:hypothetical protein